jgi:dTDP-4-dehydrorhamnose reductase
MSVRALVFGGTGMLGRALVAEGRRRRYPVLGLSHVEGDITDHDRVAYWVDAFRPELILNCAAFTRVDDCEHNPATAFAINELGPLVLAEAASRAKARLVHVSTDYVFPGNAREPYREDAATGPASVYGESKLAGERRALTYERALVVRTSWLFGPGGPNFVATIAGRLAKGEPLKVVDDQVGCPTYAPYLANALWKLAGSSLTGVVHYRNRDAVSWHGFACEIARMVAPGATVTPVSTTELQRPAKRPAYSVLDVARFEAETGASVEPWLAGLAEYLFRARPEGAGAGGAA